MFQTVEVESFRSQHCRRRNSLHSKRCLRVVKPFSTHFSAWGRSHFWMKFAWPFFGKPFFGTRQHALFFFAKTVSSKKILLGWRRRIREVVNTHFGSKSKREHEANWNRELHSERTKDRVLDIIVSKFPLFGRLKLPGGRNQPPATCSLFRLKCRTSNETCQTTCSDLKIASKPIAYTPWTSRTLKEVFTLKWLEQALSWVLSDGCTE